MKVLEGSEQTRSVGKAQGHEVQALVLRWGHSRPLQLRAGGGVLSRKGPGSAVAGCLNVSQQCAQVAKKPNSTCLVSRAVQ